jgi:integrase
MKDLVAVDSIDKLLILPQRKVRLHGIEFDEDFLSALVAKHLTKQRWQTRPRFSDAYEIYMRENPSAHRRKFRIVAQQAYSLFLSQFGDVALDELRHAHITQFRDCQLARGLHPNSVRRHINMLNAMLNMAFKHLDIDRLSPFRGLYIRGEGELSRTIAPISLEHLRKVKAHLLDHPIESRLAALIQLNTGMRISEPVLARLEDLVLDNDIPHLWIRPNQLTQRKTQASIRCVPLLGASLEAAKELHRRATRQKSEWLIPQYATEIGNTSCAATLNKYMCHLGFKTHMFRHAFIDRLKACGDIPLPIAEAITGHGRNTSDFAHYGSVGYTLEQKKAVIERVLV